MKFSLEISPLAKEDILGIQSWVADMSGDSGVARAYIDRIKQRIATLLYFPDRGSPRDDLGLGICTLSFERRVIIAYRVEETVVRIERVVSASRDLEQLF